MNRTTAEAFMKEFFEKYYDRLYHKDKILVTLPNVPEDMVADLPSDDEDGEWRVWKLVPSTVTEQQLAALEGEFGVTFPEVIKAFLSVVHHLFEEPIGRNSTEEPFAGMKNAYNPHLTANGYLPFSWDGEHYFIRCVDLANMPDEERCPVVELDHETLFDRQYEAEENGEPIPKAALQEHMRPVAANFWEYLNDIDENFGADFDDDDDFED